MTDFQWNDDFHNMSSAAYADLVQKLMKEVKLSYYITFGFDDKLMGKNEL